VSIDPRLHISDNRGACPCLPPEVLWRLLDRIERRPAALTLAERVVAGLSELRRKLRP
jgi:hypothetical protein